MTGFHGMRERDVLGMSIKSQTCKGVEGYAAIESPGM